MTRPDLSSVPQFYKRYVEHVKDMDVLDALRESNKATLEMIRQLPESKGEFRYEPGKWSIKELLVHMMDAERIFAYRALRFSRNDKTPLHGFEENDYAPEANAHSRTLSSIADEMERLRAVNIDLFKSFTPEMLQRIGNASKVDLSVLHLGYIIAGHERHHQQVLKERYLK